MHLCAFLEHGEIEISNNQVENAIRPFVVGRKGWLFADTPQGAEASAIIYSLMETAKANSPRLDDYLLSILPERAERNKDFEVDDLLSEEMKSWFSAVCVLGTTTFLYRGIIEQLRRDFIFTASPCSYAVEPQCIRRYARGRCRRCKSAGFIGFFYASQHLLHRNDARNAAVDLRGKARSTAGEAHDFCHF